MKKIIIWIAVFVVFLLACMTNAVGFLFGIIAAALIAPINKWQELLAKFLKKPIKIIAVVLAMILMLASFPSVSDEKTDNLSSDIDISSSQQENESTNENLNVSSDIAKTENDTDATSEMSSIQENESTVSSEQSETNNSTVENNSSAQTHIHTFAAATCTLPQKCSCGETSGAANGHNWTNATCTSPKICNVCGAKEGTAVGHKFSDGSCSVCGATDPDYIPSQTNNITYVLNTKTMKFHLLSCGSLPEDNREDTTKSREEIIKEGYEPCKRCHP